MSEVKFKLAAGTNVGLIRQNNEDNFVVCPDFNTSDWLIPQDGDFAVLGDLGALLVVADGMGGANAGEVASAIAVQTIQDLFKADEIKRVIGDDKAIQKFMVDVVKAADMNILNRSKSDKASRGMGTTIVMAWILGQRAYVCWCGDSRCYALTQHNGLVQISKDHSFVQELVDRGELEAEYMHDHPLSNVITRCLGDLEKRALPETRIFELYDGDTILLCSDGLSGMCLDDQIEAILHEYGENPMECKNELISAALSNGGHDNVTVALCTVQIEHSDISPIKSEKPVVRIPRNTEAEELRSTVKTGRTNKNKKRKEVPLASPELQQPIEPQQHVESPSPDMEEQIISQDTPEPDTPQKENSTNTDDEAADEVKANSGDDVANETAEMKTDKESEEETSETEDTEKKDSSTDTDNEGEKEKKEDEDNKEKDENNEKETLKVEKPSKQRRVVWYILMIILLLVFVGYCIWTIPACEPMRDIVRNMVASWQDR